MYSLPSGSRLVPPHEAAINRRNVTHARRIGKGMKQEKAAPEFKVSVRD
jgi:hypothetical protein